MQPRASARFAALLVVAYIGIGLPIGAIGVAWPQIRDTFDQPLSALGVLLITFTVGNLVASVVHGRIAHRVGTGRLLVASELAGLMGLALFAVAPVWPGLLVAMALLGVAIAGLDAELNSYVAVHHGARLLHLMHGGFGIGATLGPLAVAVLLGTDLSWRLVYVGMALLWLVVAALFVVRRHRWVAPPRVVSSR
jgi:MFS family permease